VRERERERKSDLQVLAVLEVELGVELSHGLLEAIYVPTHLIETDRERFRV